MRSRKRRGGKRLRGSKCSPAAFGKLPGTCLNPADLQTLKRQYNQKTTKKIKATASTDILRNLFIHQPQCENDLCLVTKILDPVTKGSVVRTRFRPIMPTSWGKNINEWLSSSDITNVLRQYEDRYPRFRFLGPSPTDFDFMETPTRCVWQSLCKFKLSRYIKAGKTKVGIVFNLDPHDKPGSHWVALYIDIPSRAILYFDSTGEVIHTDILRFAEKVVEQSNSLNRPFIFDPDTDQNHPIEHQFGDTECGMYVLFYIITMLESSNPRETYKTMFRNEDNQFPDKEMERLRYEFFNEPEIK